MEVGTEPRHFDIAFNIETVTKYREKDTQNGKVEMATRYLSVECHPLHSNEARIKKKPKQNKTKNEFNRTLIPFVARPKIFVADSHCERLILECVGFSVKQK